MAFTRLDQSYNRQKIEFSKTFPCEPTPTPLACCPAGGQRRSRGARRPSGVPPERVGSPSRIPRKEHPIPAATAQGNSREAPRRNRISQKGEQRWLIQILFLLE
ncbi:hypothetical protein ATANTOWER_025662 [Ataeniobius toweri]|uniref:Uncharacterized protein n=1 Tax=Ataeniobius toweri TaxID=208326 RepID=A0ABU7AZR2_9TELE|nr:hypothetical protein [Ataeniobius toweri]